MIGGKMKNWYLLYCKPKNEQRAVQNFANQGIDCFLPLMTVEKIVRGKKRQLSEVLFPCYLFIYFDPEQLSVTTVESTRGASRLICFGGKISPIPVAVVEKLMTDCGDVERSPRLMNQLPKSGDKVEIIVGCFKGIDAIYHLGKGAERSIVFLNLLGSLQTLDIDNKSLKL
jgi:transcriptional antiterminator RfaH